MNCINVVNNLLDLEHFSGEISPIQHIFLKCLKDIFCFFHMLGVHAIPSTDDQTRNLLQCTVQNSVPAMKGAAK